MTMSGRKQWDRRLKSLNSPKALRQITQVVYVAADDVRAEAFQSISRGSVSGAGHVPSSPGEPPNRDTGNLQAGLETVKERPLEAEVHATAAHSVPLEFGTSRMAARPFLRPARDKVQPRAEAAMLARLNKIVDGSAD